MSDPEEQIQALLKRPGLHPKNNVHSDRVDRMKKFRKYLSKWKKDTPEFSQEDISMLFFGVKNTALFLMEEEEEDSDDSDAGGGPSSTKIYGLLRACGSPSSKKHEGGLKRSCKEAMVLLKYLVCDFVELENGQRANNTSIEKKKKGGAPVPRSVFQHAFCSLAPRHYKMLALGLHLEQSGGKKARGAAPDEACRIIALLIMLHYSEDGQSLAPLQFEDVVGSANNSAHQDAFGKWTKSNLTAKEQELIAKRAQARGENEMT